MTTADENTKAFLDDEPTEQSGQMVRRVASRLVEVVCEAPALASAILRTPERVAAMLAPLLAHEPQEVSRGTLTTALVHPREVFGPALRMGAAAILVAHNHPSGDPEGSLEDVEISRRLRATGTLLGVPLLDSLVVCGADKFWSARINTSVFDDPLVDGLEVEDDTAVLRERLRLALIPHAGAVPMERFDLMLDALVEAALAR
jgi:hypothetical protein